MCRTFRSNIKFKRRIYYEQVSAMDNWMYPCHYDGGGTGRMRLLSRIREQYGNCREFCCRRIGSGLFNIILGSFG